MAKEKKSEGKPARALSPRERLLLTAFVWVMVLIGASVLWQQYRKLRAEEEKLQQDAQVQDVVLARKAEVEAALAEHVERMRSSATLEGATLQGLVDALARQCNLTAASVVPRTEEKGGVQILSVRVTFNDAPMERLLVFEDLLGSQRIRLVTNRVQIDAGRNDTLRVVYDIATYHLRETEKH